MAVRYKKWVGLGVGAVVGTALLAACGEGGEAGEHGEGEHGHEHVDTATSGEGESGEGEAGEGGEGEAGESGEGEGGESGEGEGESGGHADALPIEKRVAFMSGHVATGLKLYRAGAPDQAAKHLLHPVSETHSAEREGIDALGFDGDLFVAVSEALEESRPAEEVGPMLAAAEENLALIRQNAGGDPVELIAYLMDTIVDEYSIGVTGGIVTDPGEYQDAYGFAVVALDIAGGIDRAEAAQTVSELETLVALWPETGPLADSTPTPVADVIAQTSQVHLSLYELK